MLVGVLPALHAPADVNDALKDGTRGSTRGGGMRACAAFSSSRRSRRRACCSSRRGCSFAASSTCSTSNSAFVPSTRAALRVDPAEALHRSRDGDRVLRRRAATRARGPRRHARRRSATSCPLAAIAVGASPARGRCITRGQYPEAFIRVVSDGYFRAMGIPLRAGRDFSDGDTPDAERVVIVNESLARTLWPDRDAIGQAIGEGKRRLRVIGVVGDVRHDALENAFTGELYYPMRQFHDYSAVNLVVRTDLCRGAARGVGARGARADRAGGGEESVASAAAAHRQGRVAAALRRDAARRLRGVRARARGARDLRAHLVRREPAHAGDRHSHRARRVGGRRAGDIMRGTLGLAAAGIVLGVAVAGSVVPSLSGMLFGVTWADPASFGRRSCSSSGCGGGGAFSGAPGVAGRSERRVA